MSPKELVRAACAEFGADVVVRWCVTVLAGGPWEGEVLDLIGGPAAKNKAWLANPANQYWCRVWAARALLYVWAPSAAPTVVAALNDEAWRVREMAAKVARLRDLGEAGDVLSTLVEDETPRVRLAAVRALALVGEAEHAEVVTDAQDDPDSTVRNAAVLALQQMSDRLDRPL